MTDPLKTAVVAIGGRLLTEAEVRELMARYEPPLAELEPVGQAMFSETIVDGYPPREVQSRYDDLIAAAEAEVRPPPHPIVLALAIALIVAGIYFAAGLFSPHG